VTEDLMRFLAVSLFGLPAAGDVSHRPWSRGIDAISRSLLHVGALG